MNEEFVLKETRDILNDSNWAGRQFIFLKKHVPGKRWPVSGFLFFDDRRTVYDADQTPRETISDLVPHGNNTYEVVRKPGVNLDRSQLPLVKRYETTADMVRDGWIVD